jgi:hypothetical protein
MELHPTGAGAAVPNYPLMHKQITVAAATTLAGTHKTAIRPNERQSPAMYYEPDLAELVRAAPMPQPELRGHRLLIQTDDGYLTGAHAIRSVQAGYGGDCGIDTGGVSGASQNQGQSGASRGQFLH